MELAGLKVVMEADFDAVYSGFKVSESMAQEFAKTIKAAFNGIPDFGKKFNFTSNGASQAAQDAREYARAAREQAAANLDAAKAADIAAKAEERKNKKDREAKDLYGQLVAENQALVREYYNAAAAQIKFGDASGITAAKLEELRQKAKAGQDQLQAIEQGAGRFQRNVGNYASGFNPLNNSINQLTREFPAFANSVQTGLLGISNNIAPLSDALQQIRRETAAARAETVRITSAAYAAAEAKALDAGATAAEAKAEAKHAAALAIATPEQLKAVAAARAKAALLASVTGLTNAQTSALLRQAEAQALANTQSTAAPTVLSRLSSAVFSWQTALSIGITLLTVYGPKLFEMIKGTKGSAEAKKRLKEEQDALNNADKQAIQQAGEQIGKLRTLQATMTNQELTMRQRTIAYNEAQKLYPAYLSNVSKDDALNGGLADTIRDRLIPAIIAAAKARAYQDKINILTSKQIDLEEQANELTKERLKAQNELNTAQSNFKGVAGSTAPSEMENGLDQAGSSLSKSTNNVKDYTNALNDNAEERVKIIQDIDKMTHKLDAATTAAGDLNKANPLDKPAKAMKDRSEIIVKAAEDVRVAWFKLSQIEEKVLQTKPDTSAIPFDALSKGISEENERVARGLAAQLEIVTDFNAKARKNAYNTGAEMAELLKGVQTVVADTLAQTAVLVAEGIGNIIAGTDGIGALFKNIGQFLGDQIITFGKQLIAAGGLMQAAQAAIKALSITPVLAVVAGGAAIALGAALKAALSKSSKNVGRTKFADGGVVYGPTNALVGEYAGARSNPEVIAPLDKLTSILKQQNVGGGQVVIIPDVRLSGQDILISFERAQKAKNR